MIGICVFWFAIVSLFSSQTGAESGKVSEKVTKKLLEIKDKLEIVVEHYQDTNEIIIKGIQIQPSTKKRIDKWEVSVRKMAHFMLFLCGGFLIYWILKVYSIKMAGVRAVILGMFLSCMDELHQKYTQNRTPQIKDVGIDTCGIIVGVLCAFILWKIGQIIRKKRRKKNDKFQTNHS